MIHYRPLNMRCLIAALSALCIALALGAQGTQGAEAKPQHVRALVTHDFHGSLQSRVWPWSQGRQVGGAVALQYYLDKAANECHCTTVRLDGGDQMQGSLESNLAQGRGVVAMFNHLGLDAAAVGNHELDWGLDVLQERERDAHYAWLAANIFLRDTNTRPAWAKPYAMIERDGLRIGVVGYATLETPTTLRPQVTAPYEFRGGYAGIRDVLDAVWKQKPDFVAIVAHAGGECRISVCSGELVQLAAQLPAASVQLIVGGHDHSTGQGVVNGIPIIRAGSNGQALAVVDLFRQADGVRAFNVTTQTLYADEVKQPDMQLTALIAPYLAAAERVGKERITTLTQPLTSSPKGDRQLGNLIAEALRQQAQTDIGVQNSGGVRANLMAGEVRYDDVYKVLPFGNTLVKLTLTGAQLKQLVAKASPDYYYANLRAEHDGGKLKSLTLANGTPIDDARSYSVAIADFLAQGGDGLSLLVPLPQADTGMTLLDATVNYLRQWSQ